MPAIQIARIRHQAAQLAEHFSQPEVFIRKLEDLFEFYGDRTRRPRQMGAPPPILKTYKVPDPVMRRILIELVARVADDPEGGFVLVDALWEQPILELRMLAVSVLGKMPSAEHERILERLEKWAEENEEDTLLEAMARDSLVNLLRETPEMFLGQVERWLIADDLNLKVLGLRALTAQLTATDFENLPVAYQLLDLVMDSATRKLRPYLLDVIILLAKRSPSETAYFLGTNMKDMENPVIRWVTRQSMDSFPEEVQDSLRGAMRKD